MKQNVILRRLLKLLKWFRVKKSHGIILMTLFLALMMTLEFLSLYNDDFEKSINANIENRSFKVVIPLEQEIEPVSTFLEKSEIVQAYDIYKDENFNLYVVTFVLQDYWQKEAIENQLLRINPDVSFYGSNFDLESIMIFHFGSNLKVFLKVVILFLILIIFLTFVKCNKAIKDELFLLKALGYQKKQVLVILIGRSLRFLMENLMLALLIEIILVRNVFLFLISKESHFSDISIKWFLNMSNTAYLTLFFIGLTVLYQIIYEYNP
ncbi:hypothetical protein [Fusibacter sp. 3D3]|uniref:hypothetical protein n=1 Tax=Fusibacter sp. 3D3 TaxID=1048380 RepID=UPI000853D45E|nr:hypothetical protein [Fusibacter sp. 3D3]GAU79989.1 hypothetical protein F3D3_4654 [Fusibacter sp. 3D3]